MYSHVQEIPCAEQKKEAREKFLFLGGCVEISHRNKISAIKRKGMFRRTLTFLIPSGLSFQNYLFSSVIVLSEPETAVIPQ